MFFFNARPLACNFSLKPLQWPKYGSFHGKDDTKVPKDVSFYRLSKRWVRWYWLLMINYTMLYHVQLSDFVVWNLVFIFVFSPKNADKSGVHPSLLLWYGEGRAPQRAWNRSGLPKTQVKVCCSPCVVAAELHSLPNRYSFCKFYQILWLLSLSRNGLMQLMWRFQFNFVF